jgi:hypothetical protein
MMVTAITKEVPSSRETIIVEFDWVAAGPSVVKTFTPETSAFT